jgi:hypothetical protein
LTIAEFLDMLKAYERREERSDYRIASLICAIHNKWEPEENRITPDEILGRENSKPEQTTDEQLEIIQRWNEALGGKVIEREGD